MQDLNISLIQTMLHWQDPAANRRHFETELDTLESGSDLIVLPEMFSTGFTMDARPNAESMTGKTVTWMAEMAAKHNTTLCGSLIIEDQGHCYNRLIWMPPNGQPDYYDKRHLFRMADEQNHYAAGKTRKIFALNGWRICPLVCYDLRFPVWSRGVNEIDLMIYVANWPATRRSAWQVLLPARAVENQCYAVGVNRIGSDGNAVNYAGDSVVIDFFGNPLIDCGEQSTSVSVRLNGAALTRYREKFPAYLDADRFRIE
jgi:predicted amidohydrolase